LCGGACTLLAYVVVVMTQTTYDRNDVRNDARARVEELQHKLVDELAALQNAHDWRRLLDMASRLHRYSAGNALLIAVQHAAAYEQGLVSTPTPTYVAGFNSWKLLGRSVEKGQHGYAILAPAPRKVAVAVGGDDPSSRRPLAKGEKPRPGERVEVEQRMAFKVEHVFDVSQTAGAPLPELPRPQPLTGLAPDGLVDGMELFVAGRGFTVGYVDQARAIGGADGVTRFDAQTVKVRSDMAPAAIATTMAHEVGHLLLHDPQRDPGDASVHRGIGEVEAESVAYIVMAAHGVDSSSESLPYIATWAPGHAPVEVVQATAQRVIGAAHELLASLDTVQHGDGAPPGLTMAIEARQHSRTITATAPSPALSVGM